MVRGPATPDPEPGAIDARTRHVLRELGQVLAATDVAGVVAVLVAVRRARRVFFAAQGRSGLVARALAMRWVHLGATAYVAGEAVTPAIGDGDLLVCLSASGQTAATLRHADTAAAAGARIAALTATPTGPLASTADLAVVVPAGTAVATVQHAGSLFEQACLILGDVMCGAFQESHGIPDSDLDRRHANLL